MYWASTVMRFWLLLNLSTTSATSSSYWDSSACHQVMVMGSVTSYLLGSAASEAAALEAGALEAAVPALPVEPPPEQAVSAVAAARVPVAIRKLRREIFFITVLLSFSS